MNYEDKIIERLSLAQCLIFLCAILTIISFCIGFLAGEFVEMKVINDQINNSAREGFMIQNDYGYFTVRPIMLSSHYLNMGRHIELDTNVLLLNETNNCDNSK